MSSAYSHLLRAMVATPLLGGIMVQSYIEYHITAGANKHYPKPNWNICSNQGLIEKREPLVKVVKDALELAPLGVNAMDEYLTDDVSYEDPYTMCLGKDEVLRCFSVLPKVLAKVDMNQFEVAHHPNFICIVHSNENHFRYPAHKKRREGNLILQLESRDGREKIKRIIDEWNGHVIPSRETSSVMGYAAQQMRRLRTIYGLQLKTRTENGGVLADLYFKVRAFFVDVPLTEEQQSLRKSLESPKPERVRNS